MNFRFWTNFLWMKPTQLVYELINININSVYTYFDKNFCNCLSATVWDTTVSSFLSGLADRALESIKKWNFCCWETVAASFSSHLYFSTTCLILVGQIHVKIYQLFKGFRPSTFFTFYFFVIFYVCMCVWMYSCAYLYAGDFRGQKMLDLLEVVVNCPMCVLGTAFMFFARAEKWSFVWIHLFSPFSLF